MLKRAGHAVQTSVLAGQQQHAAAKAGGTYALDVAACGGFARRACPVVHGPRSRRPPVLWHAKPDMESFACESSCESLT